MEGEAEAVKANALYLEGKHSAAIDAYTVAIEKQPKSAQLYCNRAAAYFQMELYRRCINDCNTAIQLDKSYLRAYLRKGQAFVALEKPKDAIATWNAGAAQMGPNVDVELLATLKDAPNTMLSPSSPQTPVVAATPAPATPTVSTVPPTSQPVTNPMNIIKDLLKQAASSSEPSDEALSLGVAGPTQNVDPSVVAASAVVAAKGAVQHGVGLANIDEKIALGYLQVNTGNYKEGIMIFDQLLRTNPRVMAAYIGRGTAFALLGMLDKAIADFSQALDIDRNCVDAWKRRGQSRAASGNDTEALYDLTKAADLDPADHEVFHQRGLVYYKMRNYRRAMADFKKAVGLAPANKLSWNHLGLCLCALGRVNQAIKSHKKASSQDPNFKEAWANMAQAYKELGQTERAEYYFTKSIRIDPNYVHAYHLRGLSRFAAGDHRGALEDFDNALKVDPNYKDALQMRGVVRHGLGMHRAALRDYNALVAANPSHVAWYNKEVALFTHHHLDTPINSFNIDRGMDPAFKEGWCKRLHPSTLPNYTPQGTFKKSVADVQLKDTLSDPDGMKLVEASRSLGVKLQLNSPGYSRNQRQHRFCGLSVIEIAQQLREVWKVGPKNVTLPGKASSSSASPHEFGWRDVYDIAIRWRQFSEPNDPVWWVDLLTPEQFAEGFGSHTPMITGQTCVVRYYPMWSKAFPIMKNLIKQHPTINEDMKKAVDEAKDNKALHDLMKRDFWVTTPCHSTARPGVILEGTRLTLQYSPPEGYEYSIRTPGTPPRWVEYDYEMNYIFNALAAEASKPDFDLEKVSDLILTLTFYWYNYMPLSRGTAAVGYTVLLGLFLSVGIEITAPVIEGQQVDWEGILRPTPEDFIAQLKPWMYPARKATKLLDDLPDLTKTFPTLRHRIEALNVL